MAEFYKSLNREPNNIIETDNVDNTKPASGSLNHEKNFGNQESSSYFNKIFSYDFKTLFNFFNYELIFSVFNVNVIVCVVTFIILLIIVINIYRRLK